MAEVNSNLGGVPSQVSPDNENRTEGFVFDGCDTYVYQDPSLLFSPEKTFDCGQCFRWEPVGDSYEGVVSGKKLLVSGSDGIINVKVLAGAANCSFASYLGNYFDIGFDYSAATSSLTLKDPVLRKACECSKGIRLLRQDVFETVISFIISANNNIPRIKKCIDNICRIYGKLISDDCFAFPEPSALAAADPDELQKVCRVGYRSPYIVETARRFADGSVNADELLALSPKDSEILILSLPGVGPKVLNCIMLFTGLDRSSFPVDVWVERMMVDLYGLSGMTRNQLEKYGREYFGESAGLAQQYLFYYIREISRK